MTIRRLLVLTTFIAMGLAMLRPAFGIGVFLLGFVPLAGLLLTRRSKSGRLRKLRWALICLSLIPLYAVSLGPYLFLHRAAWGNGRAPDWLHAGYATYRPLQPIWSSPKLHPFATQFEDTWENLGMSFGQRMGLHDELNSH